MHSRHLKNLKQIAEPVEGALIVWQDEEIPSMPAVAHMGVVTSKMPLLITNRECAGGGFIENQSFQEIMSMPASAIDQVIETEIPNYYSQFAISYYLPGELRKKW